jgi:signal transduction histidine kinase/ligand-binding sensor domain-containing protein
MLRERTQDNRLMMRVVRMISPARWLPLLLLSAPAFALNPDTQISQYGHTAWLVQDGLIATRPNAITQTQDGYLWIGTASELLRFDGVRFVPWTAPGSEILQHAQFNRLYGARDGSLWLATQGGGLWHWKDQHLTHPVMGPGEPEQVVEDPQGAIWFVQYVAGSRNKAGPLCEVVTENVRCNGPAEGLPLTSADALARDNAGHFWLGTETGVVEWTQGSFKTYRPNGLAGNLGVGVSALAVRPDNSIWVGVEKGGPGLGLEQVVDGVWKPASVAGWNPSSWMVTALLLDRDGALWVGTHQGLYRVHAGQVGHFGAANGLSSDLVNALYEDREGNVWVLTHKGLDRFRESRVISFSQKEGMTFGQVDTVAALRDGAVLAGGGGGLNALRAGKISSLSKQLAEKQVTTLFQDHAARLWVGIDRTLTIYENGRFREIKRSDGSSLGLIVGMTEDTRNDIWAEVSANPRRLVQIRDTKVLQEIATPTLPAARKLAADPKDGIWLGLMSGDLARYRQGKLEIFRYAHQTDSLVNELIVTADGSVLGATDFGVIGWKDGQEQTLTVRNGLPCDRINTLISDNQGSLWMSTQCGLVTITQQELQRWWKTPDTRLRVKVFDATDGVQAGWVPFNGAARSSDGRLWFANGGEVQVIDPSTVSLSTAPPRVYIEEVVADSRAYSPEATLQLPALTRDLSIRYTAPTLAAPQKLRFRYMLEGQDEHWQDAGTRREAIYTNLRPGHYAFRVIAADSNGTWTSTGASLNFFIAAAYYQTRWFYALCELLAVAILLVLYRARMHQLAVQIRGRLEERLSERERIARELHDTLLQSVQGLIWRFQAVADRISQQDPARVSMEQALERADQLMGESRDRVKDLRATAPETADLSPALAVEGKRLSLEHPAQFRASVEGIPRDLHPIVREEVLLIAREALGNAFRHAAASHIEAEVSYGDEALHIRIRDDGAGISAEVLQAGGTPGHFGLLGMRERAQKLSGQLNIWSKPGAGTEVDLQVPGNVAYRPTVRTARAAWWLRKGVQQ